MAAKAPIAVADAAKKATRYAADLPASASTTAGSTARIPLGPATPCTRPMDIDHPRLDSSVDDWSASDASASDAPSIFFSQSGASPPAREGNLSAATSALPDAGFAGDDDDGDDPAGTWMWGSRMSCAAACSSDPASSTSAT